MVSADCLLSTIVYFASEATALWRYRSFLLLFIIIICRVYMLTLWP